MDKGVAFLTRSPENLLKSNSVFYTSDFFGNTGEPVYVNEDLLKIEPLALADTTTYEFHVYIADPAKKQLNISYQFGAEYNDAFAFLFLDLV